MPRKKTKSKYDPYHTLHPQALDGNLEEVASRLYELSLHGSKPLWKKIKNSENLKQDTELRKQFLAASHAGMREAQSLIISQILSTPDLNPSQSALFRSIADSMAWQLVGNQLCYARRFYKGHKPVDLKHSNFGSVVIAAEHLHNQDPGSFSLISDTTSFIQVGDLITISSTGNFTVAEVKEGRKNHEIMNFMHSLMKSECPHLFYHFAQTHGESGIKQLERMFRQAERMGHVTQVMTKGNSQDPDTNHKIFIPDETIYLDDWNHELNSALAESDLNGWSLKIVDDCLFIGVYSEAAMKGFGHVAFNLWFDNFEGTPNCPRARLLDCLTHPLAPPIFNWSISDKHKFDILFGRKNVCLALNINALINQLINTGLRVREASNKEASQMDQKGMPPYRHNGKAIFIGNGQREIPLMDGVFLRILFHSQRPIETIQAILNTPFNEPPVSPNEPDTPPSE
ncbi:hypothetical protein [Pseudomonas sp. S1_F04]